jgi:hypothetical protein
MSANPGRPRSLQVTGSGDPLDVTWSPPTTRHGIKGYAVTFNERRAWGRRPYLYGPYLASASPFTFKWTRTRKYVVYVEAVGRQWNLGKAAREVWHKP